MRFATFLTALGAAVAIASPIHQALHKRVIVYDIITETDYVTVTEGAVPTQTPEGVKTVLISTTVWVNPVEASEPSSYAVPPPPPAPTTTCITTEPTPAPAAPTTTEPAPAAVPTTTSEAPPPAEPAPTTTTEEAAPVAQSTTSVAAVAAASPTDYNSAAIDHHNYHRANHSAPDITWSDSLAASALVVANSCVFAHDMTVAGGGYGQNLAAYGSSSSNFDSLDLASVVGNAITEQWYNGELAYIPWGEDSPSTSGPEFLHATQVIWKSSIQVGCATVNCAAGTIFPEPAWYTVCNYGPEGNILGEFNSQLGDPIGLATIHATID